MFVLWLWWLFTIFLEERLLLLKNLAVNSFFFKRNYHFNFNSQSCTKLLAKQMYYSHIFIDLVCNRLLNQKWQFPFKKKLPLLPVFSITNCKKSFIIHFPSWQINSMLIVKGGWKMNSWPKKKHCIHKKTLWYAPYEIYK